MHCGHDVDAVDNNLLGLRRAQGSVKHGAFFRHVDLLAAEHRLDAPTQAAFLRKPHEQPDRLVSDAVLRVVEVNAGGFGREALAAPGIVGEELPQMQAADRLVMLGKSLPRPPPLFAFSSLRSNGVSESRGSWQFNAPAG